MKNLSTLLLVSLASLSLAQSSKPTVYLEPQQGFETYIAAAIAKKGVPVDVVTDKHKAAYILRSAPVEVKSESTGGKIARCLFAYCAGIEDKGNVSVQLIEAGSSRMAWAYSVNKQRGGSKNQQSMAEAIAKHFKEFLSGAHPTAEAPTEAQAQDSAATPDEAPAQPSVHAAAATESAPAPTPVAYQRPAEPPTQTTSQVISQDESVGDAARRAKQHKQCLDLAKNNPSIVCQ